MLRNGNIPEAIQYYEAGVQQNPQDSNVRKFKIYRSLTIIFSFGAN